MDIVDIFQFIKEHNKYDLWRISMILIGNVPALLWLIDSRLYSIPTDHKQLRSFQIHLLDKHEIRKNYMVNFLNLYTWNWHFFSYTKCKLVMNVIKLKALIFLGPFSLCQFIIFFSFSTMFKKCLMIFCLLFFCFMICRRHPGYGCSGYGIRVTEKSDNLIILSNTNDEKTMIPMTIFEFLFQKEIK